MDAVTDLYPSRYANRPSILPRQDPVIHPAEDGAAAKGPLAAEALAAFERDGYLFLDAYLDAATVEALIAETAALWREAADSDEERVIREPGGTAVRSIFAIHASSAAFGALAADPRLAGVANQILGGPVYIHQSRINYKPGFDGKEFYWHSDFETWHMEDGMPRMRALSMSVALTDNTPHNGPLMVIPGSHRHYVACVGETPEEHYRQSLRRQRYGVPDQNSLTRLVEQGGIAAPTGRAGSVVLFDCNAMHGSNGNITPLPRSNLFIVYNSVDNALLRPFAGTAPRPDFIASRDPRPIVPR